MSEYPWNEKNNTLTWLSSLYNPFKGCGITFYRIPKGKTPFEAQRRQDWIKAVNRDQWSEE